MQDPQHLRLVVEAAPIAIVIADAKGSITLVNQQAEKLFGYDRNELLGSGVEVLVPERFRAPHPGLRAGYLDLPATRAMGEGRDLYGLRKDGTEVPIEIGLNPVDTPEGHFTLAAILDITERKQAEEHLRLVVDAAPNVKIVVDSSGTISLANAQAEKLFGYAREELVGAPVEMLIPERFRGGHGVLREGYAGSPEARPMGAGRELFARRKDGSEIPVEIGLNPLRTPKGEFVLASVVDITERMQAEELRRQRDRALDASSLKSQFVATMSHELRTPLNAIIGMAELLGATPLDERQRGFIEAIEESAEALLGIISSILDFSKIEAGKLELSEHDFDVAALVEGAAGVLAEEVRKKALTLHVAVDPRIPPLVRGDADRLRQILLNLIGNAVKFTERGRIDVRALPLSAPAESAVVRFEVQDSGIGIEPGVLPRLFEPFVQADSSSSRRYGGTGLGLSISKRLVELMHGEIGVDSHAGRGSLFWFTARFGMPVADAGAARQHEVAREEIAAPGATAGRRARILVAEDNDSLREILEQQFAWLGASLALAADGADAIAALEVEPFDLVFMDVQMPNVDGFAATRTIRERERETGAHVPIVAMTANAFEQDREACLAAGMDDYLSKPLRMSDLRAVIERWTGAPSTAPASTS